MSLHLKNNYLYNFFIDKTVRVIVDLLSETHNYTTSPHRSHSQRNSTVSG